MVSKSSKRVPLLEFDFSVTFLLLHKRLELRVFVDDVQLQTQLVLPQALLHLLLQMQLPLFFVFPNKLLSFFLDAKIDKKMV